jgi:tRNA (cytidine/uridine-2'-O-)-methyltransferase
MLHIVLHQPEIPPNTGNIGRLCASNDLEMHLVKPLGFELSDKYLKRAAMDYWMSLKYKIHEDWEGLLEHFGEEANYWFFTTKAQKSFWSANFAANDILVFGSETKGLPATILNSQPQKCLKIPMLGHSYRSLNLSTSVGIASYEALRQVSLTTVGLTS